MCAAVVHYLIRCTPHRSSFIFAIHMQAGDNVVPPSTTAAVDVGVDMGSSPRTEGCNADPGGCSSHVTGNPSDQVLYVLFRTSWFTMNSPVCTVVNKR